MRKLFTILTLLVAIVTGASAVKVGFTSTYSDGKIKAPTVTTQDNLTVALIYGDQTTDKNKGSMYWGSTTALTYADGENVKQNRTKYNGAAVGNNINENVWSGASFTVASGYKFTVTDVQVDFAGQDYVWKYKLEVVNGDGTVEFTNTGTVESPNNSSKRQITSTSQSIVLTGAAKVKLYYCLSTSTSDSKYMYIPELYLTGTIEANTQTKYTKPSIAIGNYNASTGLYPVTLSVQNEEDGKITYTIGDADPVSNVESGTVVNVAPSTQVVAFVSGASFNKSDNASINIPAMPKLATPTISVGAYNFDKNTYPVTITTTDGGASLFYTLDGGDVQAYSAAINVAPGVEVQTYATKANMTQSDNANKTIADAPCGGTATTPTTSDTYTNNTDYVMSAITIPGACIAGQISSGSTPINGSIKTRCNQALTDGTGFYVNVNKGSVVSYIKIEGCSNQTGANTCKEVYVDGVAINFTDVTLPLAAAQGSTGIIEVSGINATQKIEFVFENTYQAQMNITVTSKVAGSLVLSDTENFNYGFGSFCAPNNFTVINGAAYKATLNEDAITLTKLEGIVPKNEGVVIVGEKGSEATIAYTTEASTADMSYNILHGTTVRTLTADLKGEATKFLTLQKSTSKFVEYTGEYFPANRAYIITDNDNTALSKAMSFDIKFADATSVKNVEAVTSVNEAKAVKKAIVNGRLVILTENGYVNALGQTVK